MSCPGRVSEHCPAPLIPAYGDSVWVPTLSHLELPHDPARVGNQLVPALTAALRALPQLHYIVLVNHSQAQHRQLCLVQP